MYFYSNTALHCWLQMYLYHIGHLYPAGKRRSNENKCSELRFSCNPQVACVSKKLAIASQLVISGPLYSAREKPVSLTYRCPCRFYESNVARANIKHLKILSTPNCSLQIVARLKSNSKQVCIDPKLKWIQEYLEKALNKRFKM
uniref:Stromal cell-derived factor 1 n=1 Tax=Ficedula albicollis TaxID=59894 RepID=A0A803VA51_FICAL